MWRSYGAFKVQKTVIKKLEKKVLQSVQKSLISTPCGGILFFFSLIASHKKEDFFKSLLAVVYGGIPFERLKDAINRIGLKINARAEEHSSTRNICLLYLLLSMSQFWHQKSSCVNQFFFSFSQSN